MSVAPAVIASGSVAAVAAVANWWSRIGGDDEPTSRRTRIELVSKPVATIAIATLGIAGALTRHHHPPTVAVVAAVAAFALCLGGDVALLPAVDSFVLGLASFLLGHLAFVVVFVALGLDRWWLGLVALAGVAVVVATVGRRIVAGAAHTDPTLAVPVRAYLGVISVMAVVGWATGRPAIVLGATAFVVSDAVLGWEQFAAPDTHGGARRWMPVTIMVTYHAALCGLALGMWV